MCCDVCGRVAFARPLGGFAGELGVVVVNDVSRREVVVDDALCKLVAVASVWETVAHKLVAKGDEEVVFEALG